jgi:hypothetical protein
MASIFEQQQMMIQLISQNISKEKEHLDKLYSEFIKKTNEENPLNNIYNTIDELYMSKVSSAKTFYDTFEDNDINIEYWYDMNKKEFINEIEDYNTKIIKKYNFSIYLDYENGYMYKDIELKNKILFISPSCIKVELCRNRYYDTNKQVCENEIIKRTFDDIGECEKCKAKNITEYTRIELKNRNKIILKLTIYIDNHMNIIIPQLKTILINNYTIFPLYGLHSIYYKLNINEIVYLNKWNEKEDKEYTFIDNIIKEFDNYLTSQDQRNKFSDGKIFTDILNFIEYNDKMDALKEQLEFQSNIYIRNTTPIANLLD